VSIIEVINNNLQDDETVKWYEVRVLNYRRRFFIAQILTFLTLGGLLSAIGLFFWYVPSWTGNFYVWSTDIKVPPIFIYLTILSIFITITVIAFIYSIVLFKKNLKTSGLKFSSLNHYELIYCITNKRWIQKDFNSLIHFSEDNLLDKTILQEKDIIFISLRLVDKVTIKKGRLFYHLTFSFERTEELGENATYQIKLKVKDYDGLKSALSQSTSIEILND